MIGRTNSGVGGGGSGSIVVNGVEDTFIVGDIGEKTISKGDFVSVTDLIDMNKTPLSTGSATTNNTIHSIQQFGNKILIHHSGYNSNGNHYIDVVDVDLNGNITNRNVVTFAISAGSYSYVSTLITKIDETHFLLSYMYCPSTIQFICRLCTINDDNSITLGTSHTVFTANGTTYSTLDYNVMGAVIDTGLKRVCIFSSRMYLFVDYNLEDGTVTRTASKIDELYANMVSKPNLTKNAVHYDKETKSVTFVYNEQNKIIHKVTGILDMENSTFEERAYKSLTVSNTTIVPSSFGGGYYDTNGYLHMLAYGSSTTTNLVKLKVDDEITVETYTTIQYPSLVNYSSITKLNDGRFLMTLDSSSSGGWRLLLYSYDNEFIEWENKTKLTSTNTNYTYYSSFCQAQSVVVDGVDNGLVVFCTSSAAYNSSNYCVFAETVSIGGKAVYYSSDQAFLGVSLEDGATGDTIKVMRMK